MITSICIKNYRLLKDFHLDGLTDFTCLIGLNGSGKTTLLQALEGIGRLAHGEARPAQFGIGCLSFGAPSGTRLEFRIEFEKSAVWTASFDVEQQKVTSEQINDGKGNLILSSENLKLEVEGGAKRATHGSLLAQWDFEKDSPPDVVKKGLQSLKNLGLLSPSLLCEPSGRSDNELHHGGWGFAGLLAGLPPDTKRKLSTDLQRFYSDTDYSTKTTQGGGKYLGFKETKPGKKHNFSSKLANDGLLRTLAILSQRYTPSRFVLFDEIENGFNQELIEKLVNELLNFNGKQVVVTTHSAVIINYLPDEIAKSSVVLFCKDKHGHTQATRFFELPEMAKLLDIMGPGQVMSRTDLEELSHKLSKAGD
jgi:energy-coupling factor transporter ATP-binding protein EcfA2